MDVFDAVRTVLAVRKFQEKPIPASLKERILQAGWLTASSMNLQPWHFIAIDDPETLRQLGSLASSGPYIAQAPFAVAVVIEESEYSVSDASRAIQSMILTGWAEGVGSNWVGFFGLDAVKPLLGVPEGLEILAIVPFGYPAEPKTGSKKKRKPFDEVVHHGRFGQI
jgi:nitroreductase